MKRLISKLTSADGKTNFILLLTLFFSLLLASPKWNVAFISFFAVFVNLRYFRNVSFWKASLFTFFVFFSASFIANQGVLPFPPPIMISILFFLSIVHLIPFILDKWLYRRLPGLLAIWVFPTASLIVGSFIANSPNGTFGHIAYNLVDSQSLMQLTSVTGIWGIALLIYLFASVANHIMENAENPSVVRSFSIGYGTLFLVVLIFGFTRVQRGSKAIKNADTIRLGSVTSKDMDWSKAIHKIVTGETIHFPKKIDQTSPELQEFQESLKVFIEDHDNPKFDPVYSALENYYDEIFASSQKAVDAGAKAILLSEGEIVTVEDREDGIIERAQNFARENNIYFFFAMGTIYPERMKENQPFIGNKVLSIDANGDIRDIYYKNVPVAQIDPSIPGDGIIDVIETPIANFSPIICYDADFPPMMRQTGNSNSDLILVATGDWYSISPYHSKIGAVRSIENGIPMLKTVSNGLSISVDPYGNVLSEDDFFADDDHVMITDIPLHRTKTMYASVGDVLIYLSYIYLGVVVLYLLVLSIMKRIGSSPAKSDANKILPT